MKKKTDCLRCLLFVAFVFFSFCCCCVCLLSMFSVVLFSPMPMPMSVVLLMDFVVVAGMVRCCFCTLYLFNSYGLDAHRMLNLRKQLFIASYCIYFPIILAHCTAILRAQHQLFAAKMLSCRAASRPTIGYTLLSI